MMDHTISGEIIKEFRAFLEQFGFPITFSLLVLFYHFLYLKRKLDELRSNLDQHLDKMNDTLVNIRVSSEIIKSTADELKILCLKGFKDGDHHV